MSESLGVRQANGSDLATSASDKGWIPAVVLLLCGIVICLLALIEAAEGVPFWMPRSWYSDRWIWILGGVGMIYGGMRLFAKSAAAQHRINERQHLFHSVVVYTRDGCHLCDEAIDLLKRYQHLYPQMETVDIDESPDLVEQFNTCVPVVEINGKVRFRGKISEVLWNRLIEGERRKRISSGRENRNGATADE